MSSADPAEAEYDDPPLAGDSDEIGWVTALLAVVILGSGAVATFFTAWVLYSNPSVFVTVLAAPVGLIGVSLAGLCAYFVVSA